MHSFVSPHLRWTTCGCEMGWPYGSRDSSKGCISGTDGCDVRKDLASRHSTLKVDQLGPQSGDGSSNGCAENCSDQKKPFVDIVTEKTAEAVQIVAA
jgi:hypothetical protein